MIILDKCISLFGERERPVIQPPVAAVVRLEAVEDESLSTRGNLLPLVTSSLRQAGVSIVC